MKKLNSRVTREPLSGYPDIVRLRIGEVGQDEGGLFAGRHMEVSCLESEVEVLAAWGEKIRGTEMSRPAMPVVEATSWPSWDYRWTLAAAVAVRPQCLKCGSDLIDGECESCAEPTTCRCGATLVDGECEVCAEVQAELDAEEAPRDDNAPQDGEP